MMLERLNRIWRIFATGFCFTCFGIGGLVLGIVVFPLMALLVRDARQKALWAKRFIHYAFRAFVELMARMGIFTYEVHGLDRLERGGLLILANHPTLIDVVFLMSFVKRADCIVKAALARNPFTRWPVLAAGFVFNDSGEGLVNDCVNSMQAGNNLIIFPEGTRTPLTGPLHLQRGAARVAVHGEIDITPIRIHCSPVMLSKGGKWYRVPQHRSHFRIEVCDTISISQFIAGGDSPALASRRLTTHLTDFFSMERRRATS